MITDACGQVEIDVPRDRNGTFEPVIVGQASWRITDVDRVVLSLYAKGLTTGEISAHFAEVYGASVSKDTVSGITDRVIEDANVVVTAFLEKVYAAVFIDAIMVKIRDVSATGRSTPRSASISTATRTSWGCGVGDGDGESAKFCWRC